MRCSAGTSGSRISPECGTSFKYINSPKSVSSVIKCNQDTVVCFGKFQQYFISRVGTKESSLYDVVPGIA